MVIKELLLNFIPSNEIKTRVANKQIKINNVVLTSDKLHYQLDVSKGYSYLGEFIVDKKISGEKFFLFNDIKDFFGDEEETNIEKFKFIQEFILLSISKKEHIVFKNLKYGY
jgi:hypothetical protein